jgi:hypothetical protein
MAGVAHDEGFGARRAQKTRKIGGVIALGVEIGKAGKTVIERKTRCPRLGAEAARQRRHRQGLAPMFSARENPPGTVGAVAKPSFSGKAARKKFGDEIVAYAGQNLHMLVSVDIIWRRAIGVLEGVELAAQFVQDFTARQGRAPGGGDNCVHRGKGAIGRKCRHVSQRRA